MTNLARMEWHLFVWAHLGERCAVTFEKSGVEHNLEGVLIAHADGSYQVGGTYIDPGATTGQWREGIPVRWAIVSQPAG